MLHYLLVKIRFTTEEVYYSKPTSIVGEVSYGFLFQNWPLAFPALSGRTTQKVRAGPRVETKSEIDDAQTIPRMVQYGWWGAVVHFFGEFDGLMGNISIWLVVSTPLKNIKISWDDYSQYM